jgi:hypothetical protein
MNPADIINICFFKIHFNVIVPSATRYSSCLSLRFSYRNFIYVFLLCLLYALQSCPLYNHSNKISRGMQVMKLLMQSPLPLSLLLPPS